MKKLTVFLCSLAMVFSVVGIAGAASYSFNDLIDTWTRAEIDAIMVTPCDPLNYTHNLNDYVNFAAGDVVTSATLELDFTNDFTDAWGYLNEYVIAYYDGVKWSVGEVDNGQHSISVDVDLLNVDGLLGVNIQVLNSGSRTAWLDHSRLYGTASTAPVPEPSTILLMGAGLLGLVAVGRRKFNRKE
jgi:hypothetical protein